MGRHLQLFSNKGGGNILLPRLLNQVLPCDPREVHSNIRGAKQMLNGPWDPSHRRSKGTRLVEGGAIKTE